MGVQSCLLLALTAISQKHHNSTNSTNFDEYVVAYSGVTRLLKSDNDIRHSIRWRKQKLP